MEKRRIGKDQYKLIQREVNFYQNTGLIIGEQADKILDLYEIRQGLSFLKVILTTGAVLVGLGVLSFIASNWAAMGRLAKFLIILVGFLGVNTASFMLEEKLPKTSRGLLYLGAMVYGGGIFLIGQIFNFGGHFTSAFLLWAIGIFPTALLFKDRVLYIFSALLLLVYLNGCADIDVWPAAMLIALPILYFSARYLGWCPLLLFVNNLVALNTVGFSAIKLKLETFYVIFLFLVIGLAMLYAPRVRENKVFQIQGSIVIGISGLLLTISQVWSTYSVFSGANATIGALGFTVIFLIYLLYQVRRESLIALIFICATIFRYYFDLTYDFLPKSVFFISSGLLLLGFGFYIERKIKNKGGMGHAE